MSAASSMVMICLLHSRRGRLLGHLLPGVSGRGVAGTGKGGCQEWFLGLKLCNCVAVVFCTGEAVIVFLISTGSKDRSNCQLTGARLSIPICNHLKSSPCALEAML